MSAANVLKNPRYGFLAVIVVLSTLYFLTTGRLGLSSWSATTFPTRGDPIDLSTIEGALARAHLRYNKILKERKEYVARLGDGVRKQGIFPPKMSTNIWDFIPPVFNCPHEVERLGGMGLGGKWVCGATSRLTLKPHCVVYSFGIDSGSSFEEELLDEAPNCEIWVYDSAVDTWGSRMSPEHKKKVHFARVALDGTDKVVNSVQHHTLQTLMKQNGHTHIDVLKIDVQGAEFDSMSTFVAPYLVNQNPLPVAQVQMQLYTWNKTLDYMLNWWGSLEDAGLRPFITEPNLPYLNHVRGQPPELAEYSFLNIKGDNILIHNP